MDTNLRKNKSIGSERKIENNLFKLTLGTLDKHNPKTIYVNSGVFITPNDDKEDYGKEMDFIRKSLNRNIKDYLKFSGLFKENFILNFEVPLNALKMGKKSHLFLQYHLIQKNDKPLKLEDLINNNENLFNNILINLKNNLEECNFSLSKTKR